MNLQVLRTGFCDLDMIVMFDSGPRYKYILLLIVLVAFTLRLIYGLSLGESLIWPDAYYYNEVAINIASGAGYVLNNGQESFDAPAFPVYLALFYSIFGVKLWIFRAFQALLASFLVLIVYKLSAVVFNRLCGILAAFITAIYPYYIYISVQILPTGIFILIVALTVWCLFKNLTTGKYLCAIFAGIFFGIGTLSVPPYVSYLPCIFIIYAFYPKLSLKNRIIMPVTIVFCFSLVITPWILRGYFMHNELYFISKGDAPAFIRGNWPNASADHGQMKEYKLSELLTGEETNVYKNMGEDEKKVFLKKKMFEYIKSHPIWFIKLYFAKFINLYRFYPSTISGIGKNQVIKWISILSYGPVFLLGLVGIFLSRRQWKELLPFYLPFLSMPALYALFLTNVRYRLPLDLYLIMFCSFTIGELIRRKCYHRNYEVSF